MSIQELQVKLLEARKERNLLDGKLRMNYHTKNRYGYDALGKAGYKEGVTNKKKSNKMVALIETYLRQKLNEK